VGVDDLQANGAEGRNGFVDVRRSYDFIQTHRFQLLQKRSLPSLVLHLHPFIHISIKTISQI
jgi:hypothetical protein